MGWWSRVGAWFLAAAVVPFPVTAKERLPVVLGYSATWYDGVLPPSEYPWEALTHVARSFLIPGADGSLPVPEGFFDPALREGAEAHGVELLISLGGQAPNAEHWVAMATDPKALRRFLSEIRRLVEDHGYHGVDVDWEPSPLTEREAKAYAGFLRALRAEFPNWTITTALGGSDYWAKHVDWDVVTETTDFINLMSYVLSGAWGGQAAHFANLYPASFPDKNGLSVDGVARNLVEKYGVPPERIVLGLIFFGDQFHVDRMGEEFPPNQPGQGLEISYSDVRRLLLTGRYREKWDEKALAPYLERKGGGHVVSYDDPRSILKKCAYVRKNGYRGVMVWNLGGDVWGSHTPLFDAVAEGFGFSVRSLPAGALARQVTAAVGELERLRSQLLRLSRLAGDPPPSALPAAPSDPASLPPEALEKVRLKLEAERGRMVLALEEVRSRLAAKGVSAGKAPPAEGGVFLFDDFEDGNRVSRAGTFWEVDFDRHGLGTRVDNAEAPVRRGGAGGSKYAAGLKGRFGASRAPWPYAVLRADAAAGGPADLSGFRAVRFRVQGDGKAYEMQLLLPQVVDYAYHRAVFTAPKAWGTVELALSDFRQPSWGAPVPADFSAVEALQFTPSGADDEAFEFWIDDLEFVR